MPMIFIALAITGLLIGSFLNVVIVRYPEMLMHRWQTECREFLQLHSVHSPDSVFNLAMPGSHCPQCRHSLAFWQNIPLLSYLILGGRCRFCQQRIGFQYPLVELMTAVATVAVFLEFGWQIKTIAACVLTWGLIVLSGIDWKKQILPDDISLSLLWIGLILNTDAWFTPLPQAVLGAVGGYFVLWGSAYLFKLIRKKQGMGNGDFKMLAMLGAWLGLENVPYILLGAVLLSLITNLSLLLAKKIRHDQPLPFGPWLAMAGWLVLMLYSKIPSFGGWVGF